MTIQTNTLSERPSERPSDEWWYALPANQTPEERIKSIEIAIAVYECRFGHPPAVGSTRMIGHTPILAYPIPVVNISIELQPEPQPEPEPTTMEVW